MRKRNDLVGCVIGAAVAGIMLGYYFGMENALQNPPAHGGTTAELPAKVREISPEELRSWSRNKDPQGLRRALCSAVEKFRKHDLGDEPFQVSVRPRYDAELLPKDGKRRFALSCDIEYSAADSGRDGGTFGAFAILRQNGDAWEVEMLDQMYPRD